MDDAVISRYLISDMHIQISKCSQIDFMSGYLDHYITGMVETVPPESFDDVKTTISFAALLAVFMPSDGILAFTISIPHKKRKIFCLFENSSGNFVARSHFWNAGDFEKDQRMAVQRVSASRKLDHISMVDCKNESDCNAGINDLFRKYLETQDNSRYDFFLKDSELILVKYDGETGSGFFDSIMSDIRTLPEKYMNSGTLFREYRFSFLCGCNGDRMISMLSRMSQDDIDYIFENENEVSIECPRCGKNYKVQKNEIKKD